MTRPSPRTLAFLLALLLPVVVAPTMFASAAGRSGARPCRVLRLGDGENSKTGFGTYTFRSEGRISFRIHLGRWIQISEQEVALQYAEHVGEVVREDVPPVLCVERDSHPAPLSSIAVGSPGFMATENGVLAWVRGGWPLTSVAETCDLSTDDVVTGDMEVEYWDGTPPREFHTERGTVLSVTPLTLRRSDGRTVTVPGRAHSYIVNCVLARPNALRVGMDALAVMEGGVAHKVFAQG